MSIIKLDGEDITLYFDMKIMDSIEKIIGSLYKYPDKCAEKNVSFKDVVTIYYYAQKGTGYNEQEIFAKVMKDGLVYHTSQTYEAVMLVVFGEKVFNELMDDNVAKKK